MDGIVKSVPLIVSNKQLRVSPTVWPDEAISMCWLQWHDGRHHASSVFFIRFPEPAPFGAPSRCCPRDCWERLSRAMRNGELES